MVVGAHLDSVEAGPGINDNGSGTSGILEIAEQVAKLDQKPRNRLRFAFWGAEEAGLVGSTAYVDEQVESGGIDRIEANLNFDMIGSPNYARFVYDGDLSDSRAAAQRRARRLGPDRGAVQPLLRSPGSGLPAHRVRRPLRLRRVHCEHVPAGGLFTGAEGIKTEEQEALFGGVAGLAYDPCYHQACDTFFNLSENGAGRDVRRGGSQHVDAGPVEEPDHQRPGRRRRARPRRPSAPSAARPEVPRRSGDPLITDTPLTH